MNIKNYIGTVLLIAILGAVVIFLLNKNKTYHWDVELRSNKLEPYDIGFLKSVLEDSYEDNYVNITKSREFELATDSGMGTMIYIGKEILLSQDHTTALMNFIERGNTAIFSSDIIPEDLIEGITSVKFGIEYSDISSPPLFSTSYSLAAQPEEGEEDLYEEDDFYNLYLEDSLATVRFMDDEKNTFSFKFIQKDSVLSHAWYGLNQRLYDDYNSDEHFSIVSKINDSICDIFSMNHGKGKVLIHMNPVLFSNIYFIEKSGFDYVNKLSSYFSDGTVYFNEYYDYVSLSGASGSGGGNGGRIGKDDIRSPMSFILSHRGLKWSFYTILLLSFLYLIFAFKRRLPAIAHFQHPKNTTLSFVKALSSFYSSAKDHALISSEMMTSFKHFLRKRYQINTNQEKEELIPLISKYSGISEEKTQLIFDLEFKINYGNDSKSKGSVELYQALESFYSNCK